jgi:undecaprenyl diphosphate synthase
MVHIGVIPDGNRRWCRARCVDYNALVEHHVSRIRSWIDKPEAELAAYSHVAQITELSIYLLSKDNLLKRDDGTCAMVHEVLRRALDVYRATPARARLRVRFVGMRELLPPAMQQLLLDIERETAGGSFLVTAAVAYDPIVDARQTLCGGAARDQSQIDVVVRTGGELRSSGFYPLNTLYSEWAYPPTLFPDFDLAQLESVLCEVATRQRRFGG